MGGIQWRALRGLGNGREGGVINAAGLFRVSSIR